jgi:murein DD-endopeptidase
VEGRPYRLGANGPHQFDCSGLVYYAYRRAGHSVPRTTREQFRRADPIHRRDMLPGDIVFFAIDGRRVSHVGIYGGNSRFIHSPRPGRGVSWADLNNPYWAQRFAGAGRF